ncbi:hypothetical protein K505DRAFT_330116 [Melanomma pulvis-pyrius CBS 109.77]|uniref:Uncharacterized protein n=1 Tax=Melanomma pulvis-pyrius CBS 109.77 TaxID=1314802 RepID=A0A6A6WS74_9PLEO|nr:hypothetical protein K505DRAFT_330116 [Melanomma pulvis-pyrius CBS 109.77]
MESNSYQQHQPNASLPGKPPVQPTSATPTTTAAATTTTHEQQPYSSDPFAPNYRHICPWSEEDKAEWIATWPLPLRADYWQVYESAEHAEYTRPWDQLRVLLRRRGLEDNFWKILIGGRDDEVDGEKTQPSDDDDEERHEKARKLLIDAGDGGELLERAEELWRMGKMMGQVRRGEIGVERLLEAGDVSGYNWIRMNPDRIECNKNNTTGGQQGSASAAAGKDGNKGSAV